MTDAPVYLLAFVVSGATLVAVLLLDAFGTRRGAIAAAWLGLAAAAVAAIAAASGPSTPIIMGGAVVAVAGGGRSAITAVVFALAAGSVAGSTTRGVRSVDGPRNAALTVVAAIGAALAVSAADLVLVVIALETSTLAGYALVASAHSPRSDNAALTYFVQGTVATGVLLLGLAGVIAVSEAAPAGQLASLEAGPVVLSSMLVLVGFAFKAGAFPMHSWAPDVYETAPPAATAFLASVPKIAALVAAASVVTVVSARGMPRLGLVLGLIAAASIAFGTLGGLKQASYRRMLGYSAIAQTGFVVVGLVGGGNVLPAAALMATVYAIATMGAFMTAEVLETACADWDGTIAGMAGLSRSRPALAFAASTCMLSLTGIPLTAGFWGKLAVFTSAVGNGSAWLAIVGLLGSVVSFGYYGAVLRAMWLDDPAQREAAGAPAGGGVTTIGAAPAADASAPTAVVLVAAVAIIAIGIAPLVAGLGVFGLLAR